jgi:hypothetical protein
MIIERLSQEHRNIEKLLAILERELQVFDRGTAPTIRLSARLLATSNFTRRFTTILRKTSSLQS